jgi:hypothetical protein
MAFSEKLAPMPRLIVPVSAQGGGGHISVNDNRTAGISNCPNDTAETVATVSEIGTESRLFNWVSQTGEQLREKLGVESVTPEQAAEVAGTLPGNRAAARLYAEGIEKLRSQSRGVSGDQLGRPC